MTDFSVNSTEIIKAAIRSIGSLSTGESLQNNELADGLEALNMVVKQLMGPPSYLMKGVNTWQRERTTLPLASKVKFEIKPVGGDLTLYAPIDIISARWVDDGDNETILKKLNLEQYDRITNKSDENTPQAFYYERKIDVGYFYLDCIPSDITNYTLDITYLDQIASLETVRSTTDFPQEWYRVLKFALATDLAPEYGANLKVVSSLRDEAITIANTFHIETTDKYFQPGID